VDENIREAFPEAAFDMHVVWVSIMPRDRPFSAFRASKIFPDSDARVRQYYDGAWLSGDVFSKSLGWSHVKAWDVYLFYGPEAVWEGETPPPPSDYAHQLARTRDGHLHMGRDLDKALRRMAGEALKEKTAPAAGGIQN
jgi:hypothetical protein